MNLESMLLQLFRLKSCVFAERDDPTDRSNATKQNSKKRNRIDRILFVRKEAITLMRTLIQNGTLVRSQGIEQADILVENGFIKRIASGITEQADEVIDAGGKLVFAPC